MSNQTHSLLANGLGTAQFSNVFGERSPSTIGTVGQISPAAFGGTGLSDIVNKVEGLKMPLSPSAMVTRRGTGSHGERSLPEQLFDATADVKILISQVAMHLQKDWRERLFTQLDRLHDIAEWDEEDRPLNRASFSTFLKAICALKPDVRPGLGLTNSGCLIAAWTRDRNRLTLQFTQRDRVKWIISKYVDEQLDQVAGDVPVERLSNALAPYHPEEWFIN